MPVCVCGLTVIDDDYPSHPYVPALPGCWRIFTEVQADEMLRFGYPPVHQLIVDAYMASHPGGDDDRRQRQSLVVHVVALAGEVAGWRRGEAVRALRAQIVAGGDHPQLVPPTAPAELTIADLAGAPDLADYTRRAQLWADQVWQAWSHEHERIRALSAAADPR